MKILLIILILHNVNALDPAAYGNPSGQLSTQDPVPNLEYQARYTINVLNRAENCFFLENLKEGYIVNIHYLVISTKNGNQLDISMRLKDAQNKLITFQARKREGHFTNYQEITLFDLFTFLIFFFQTHCPSTLFKMMPVQGVAKKSKLETSLRISFVICNFLNSEIVPVNPKKLHHIVSVISIQ
ncbi:uncharacterized protein LOC111706546 isoform X1 [Eurytemora carolleeae]|uniref:uncharacterized protein LOC111706546 isoform X1 n=1 Tax=Eurytemora carolleeae TaxID=1294199 RepID=UPI000C777348|nr:uncharacterized protein LOC111706546 isoform X1 [Eurytemora carolleeae]|eukprot:XP_023335209.1 uncharacterized protein LOC111706546 isoform X1 [Eurytemora affinis]